MGDHRIERAKERYGLDLTPGDLVALSAMVRPDNRVRKQETGGIHVLMWEGRPVIVGVAYNGKNVITTFLPPDLCNAGHGRAWAMRPKKERRRLKRR